MKLFSFFTALFFALTLGASAKNIESILTFADKTRITGQVLSIDSEQNLLTLQSPSLQEKTPLNTAALLDMSLNGKPQTVEADHYALATIKGHHQDPHRDTLRGRLIALDEDTITLDTWYAGRLTLKRSLVHTLDIFSQSPTFYTGPNGPEGWVASSGSVKDNWTFKNRTMTSLTRRGIARKVQVPDRAKITVTARWKNTPYFRILFLSSEGKADYPETGYSLNIQQSRLTLFRNSPKQRNADIFNEGIDNMREIEQTTVTIYLDRSEEGTSAVYLDDKRIATWTDVDDTKLKGEWLHFVPNRNSPLKLSDISVSQWDGALPVSEDDEPLPDKKEDDDEGPKLKGQEMRLANGDIVIGEIQKIDQDLVHLTTSFGDVKVPLRRIKNIMLAPVEDEDRMEINDVRAWFHEGGYVTIKLKSFDGETLSGYSQVYGDAEFKVSAFARIQFNIWDRSLDPARIGGGSSEW